MTEEQELAKAVSTAKRRRGVAKRSLTRFTTRLRELESREPEAGTVALAEQMLAKLETIDSDFKSQHLALVDILEDEAALEEEQATLDDHDDVVSDLSIRLKKLIPSRSVSRGLDPRKIATRRMSHVKKNLTAFQGDIDSMGSEPRDVCLIRQHEEQLLETKKELSEVSNLLISLDLEDTDELMLELSSLERDVFAYSLRLKRLSHALESVPPARRTDPESKAVKLPKIDIPTFNGNILNWMTFWEQFSIAVHSRSDISDAQKLVYLRHSVKDGSAKAIIEGLSRTGDQYGEAIESLQARYDRPRLIHQAHVRKILEVPGLKDGSGRELRHLHDVVQQHLRALKSMGCEPSGPFVTSLIELKLDQNTMFEWQKHSQSSSGVPHYRELLDFINMRAQASETSVADGTKRSHGPEFRKNFSASKPIASFMVNAPSPSTEPCVLCKGKHPLYACVKFKALPHERMIATIKTHGLCMNCLRPGHFVRNCPSSHRCRKCQRPHHSLLHSVAEGESTETLAQGSQASGSSTLPSSSTAPVHSHAAAGSKSNSLLMTCQVVLTSPNGCSTKARALLDSASSASFVSERTSKLLHLPRSPCLAKISGIAGVSPGSSCRHATSFTVSSLHDPSKQLHVSALIIPRVTCDVPARSVRLNPGWAHLNGLQLADPLFGNTGAIDVLLGVDVFVSVLLHGRRSGPPGAPVALETVFGWVLAGTTAPEPALDEVTSHHVTLLSGDDLLRKFWEQEEPPSDGPILSAEEREVVQHFLSSHRRSPDGRFVVPLPKKAEVMTLGESRAQSVRRFLSLERSLHSRDQFKDFASVMEEYFSLGHAEEVPIADLHKPPQQVFYMPMHAVHKESSSTTKLRVVFDASAKSSTGVSLNDLLMVGPTVHPPLLDVLLRFRRHKIAMTADVSKMYRAVELTEADKDYHRFVWRGCPSDPLTDFRMTRMTFGVAASSFAANMVVKQNAVNLSSEYPLAARAVDESIYVDDCLTGADTVDEALQLQRELQALFDEARLLLRKWNSSHPDVLQQVPTDLRESHFTQTMPEAVEYSKTLGVEWNSREDAFRLTVAKLPDPFPKAMTKRMLTSDVAKTFDVLGWFSPMIIKAKILLQKLWERGVGWDDDVPSDIFDTWKRWRLELQAISDKHFPRCYYPENTRKGSAQLHGFSDASEDAFAAVVYFRVCDTDGNARISLVMSKTRVAPLKRLTIPRLELCGAHLLAQVLSHAMDVLDVPLSSVHAWTDSTVVLSWLAGDPRRFKTYVGNRVTRIAELIPSDRWNHVSGLNNPADCASRGLFPLELLGHDLWWSGPRWLLAESPSWPHSSTLEVASVPNEEHETCAINMVERDAVIPLARYPSFTRLKRVTAWVRRFLANCRVKDASKRSLGPLSVAELRGVETFWFSQAQSQSFNSELGALLKNRSIPDSSCLLSLHPFMDPSGILRVGGRVSRAIMGYSRRHPVILHARHPVTKLIVRSEHIRMLHAGPTLTNASLGRNFHIIGLRKATRDVIRSCVTCRRNTVKPQPQVMGQLPLERITPGIVFEKVGVDFAGPVYLKLGHTRKPTVVKSYISVFVALSVKAVHLELVLDMTSSAFIACLRRFVARRGRPSVIWSDHGSNFVGAARELSEMDAFLRKLQSDKEVSDFCSSQMIEWSFIPEHAPHFGGLWESAVRSLKTHLRRVLGDTKLNFEEFATVLTQVEACLNSRPLVSLPTEGDGIEALTPGHFLIGRPLESLPDPQLSYKPITTLRRWNLCQTLTRHFWRRWSSDYFTSLRRFTKWHHRSRNAQVGDVVLLKEDGLVPTKWPLARIEHVHPGTDGVVRVVSIRTANGVYKRPVTKVALLLPSDSD